MMFTGTLIADLIATVERVEQLAPPSETLPPEFPATDAWLASAQENANYDSNFLVWHESGVA